MNKKRGAYTISVVAEMYQIHPQTLRSYEREGLIRPLRSEGNMRLFTDEDLERLELILTLTRELGVNLAGVEVILHMREKIERMQAEMEGFVEYLRTHLQLDADLLEQKMKSALVRVPPSQLVRVRSGVGEAAGMRRGRSKSE